MAWIDPLAHNQWRAGYRDSAGKKLYVKDEHGKTMHYGRKSDARFAGNEAEAKAKRQAPFVASTTKPVKWGEWWNQIGGNRHPDSDYDDREASIVDCHVMPRWGDVELNRISNKTVKEWIKGLSARYSANYVHHIYFVFKGSIQEAVDAELLLATPCTGKMGLPKISKNRIKSYIASADLQRYRDAGLRADYLDWLTFIYETGMRPSEVSGLHARWIDVGRLVVADVLIAHKRVIKSYPKNGEHRIVNLTDEASAILQRHLDAHVLKAGCGLPHLDGSACTSRLVFQSLTGEVIIPKYINTTLRRVAERAGFERKTPYAARRGFGTWAIDGGMASMKVQQQMGHSNQRETEGYVQRSPQERDRLQQARNAVHDREV